MTTQPPSKSIPELSVDTQLLIKRLKKAQPGDVIKYEELSSIIGASVQSEKRYLLDSARWHVLRNDRMNFECVSGEGLKRLSDSEIVEATPDHTMNKIRRTAKRGARKLACADYEKLNQDEKIRFNSGASLMGAIAHLSKPSSLQLMQPKISEAQDKLSLVKTLELFAK